MNSKRKDDIEQAISIMMEILKKEPEYIPAIYVRKTEFIYVKIREHRLDLCYLNNLQELEIN